MKKMTIAEENLLVAEILNEGKNTTTPSSLKMHGNNAPVPDSSFQREVQESCAALSGIWNEDILPKYWNPAGLNPPVLTESKKPARQRLNENVSIAEEAIPAGYKEVNGVLYKEAPGGNKRIKTDNAETEFEAKWVVDDHVNDVMSSDNLPKKAPKYFSPESKKYYEKKYSPMAESLSEEAMPSGYSEVNGVLYKEAPGGNKRIKTDNAVTPFEAKWVVDSHVSDVMSADKLPKAAPEYFSPEAKKYYEKKYSPMAENKIAEASTIEPDVLFHSMQGTAAKAKSERAAGNIADAKAIEAKLEMLGKKAKDAGVEAEMVEDFLAELESLNDSKSVRNIDVFDWIKDWKKENSKDESKPMKEDASGWKNQATKDAWTVLSNDEAKYKATLGAAKNAQDLKARAKRFGFGDEVDFDEMFKAHSEDNTPKAAKTEAKISYDGEDIAAINSNNWDDIVGEKYTGKGQKIMLDGQEYKVVGETGDMINLQLVSGKADHMRECMDKMVSLASNLVESTTPGVWTESAKVAHILSEMVLPRLESVFGEADEDTKNIESFKSLKAAQAFLKDGGIIVDDNENDMSMRDVVDFFMVDQEIPSERYDEDDMDAEIADVMDSEENDDEEEEFDDEKAEEALKASIKAIKTIKGKVTEEDLKEKLDEMLEDLEKVLKHVKHEEDEEGEEDDKEADPELSELPKMQESNKKK